MNHNWNEVRWSNVSPGDLAIALEDWVDKADNKNIPPFELLEEIIERLWQLDGLYS